MVPSKIKVKREPESDDQNPQVELELKKPTERFENYQVSLPVILK